MKNTIIKGLPVYKYSGTDQDRSLIRIEAVLFDGTEFTLFYSSSAQCVHQITNKSTTPNCKVCKEFNCTCLNKYLKCIADELDKELMLSLVLTNT
ncbi:hypothetical protein [Paenibacillus taichungensis]